MRGDRNQTWFTADTHFGHGRVMELSRRPFGNVSEMDEALIQGASLRAEADTFPAAPAAAVASRRSIADRKRS